MSKSEAAAALAELAPALAEQRDLPPHRVDQGLIDYAAELALEAAGWPCAICGTELLDEGQGAYCISCLRHLCLECTRELMRDELAEVHDQYCPACYKRQVQARQEIASAGLGGEW